MDLQAERLADRRLAIVGSRALAGHKWSRTILTGYILRHDRVNMIGISGGAAGIDQEAEQVFREFGIPFLPILSMTNGVDGFITRDRWIAWLCTDLLCIEASWSATKGARLTADMAKAFGRRVDHLIIRNDQDPFGAGVTHVCGGLKLADLEGAKP